MGKGKGAIERWCIKNLIQKCRYVTQIKSILDQYTFHNQKHIHFKNPEYKVLKIYF